LYRGSQTFDEFLPFLISKRFTQPLHKANKVAEKFERGVGAAGVLFTDYFPVLGICSKTHE